MTYTIYLTKNTQGPGTENLATVRGPVSADTPGCFVWAQSECSNMAVTFGDWAGTCVGPTNQNPVGPDMTPLYKTANEKGPAGPSGYNDPDLAFWPPNVPDLA